MKNPFPHPQPTAGRMALLISIILALSALACQVSGSSTPIRYTPPAGATPLNPVSKSWYTLYFTRPATTFETYQGGVDERLADEIDQAQLSVDVAAMQFNLRSVRDALHRAHRRGISVRMVTDSDYLDEIEVQDLIDAGIPVLGDRRESLMHDKFVIIDRQQVWTGSMNLTVNGVYRNNNNFIRIQSTRLAQDYTAEFEEMFVDDRFGSSSPANTPYPKLTVNGMDLEVLFSPDDGVADRILGLINQAEESVHFMAFSFTSDEIADAMIERSRAGVQVSGVMDTSQYKSNEGTEFDRFKKAGLEVRLDGNRDAMHHKVIVIYGETVITGSYNYSYNAEKRNDENVLVLHSPEVAGLYLSEFERVWAEAGD